MPDRREFAVKDGTWLAMRLHESKVQVSSLRDALKIECLWREGQGCAKGVLDEELQRIAIVPEEVPVVRCDKAEQLAAKEEGRLRRRSVDVCSQMMSGALLIECKYRACPETSLVKSLDAFNSEIVEKFENSSSFLINFLNLPFFDDRVVLFNHDSVEKVLSMFNRLRLENDDVRHLSNYVIVDTIGFLQRYFPVPQ